MKDLICEYKKGCDMVKCRIHELNDILNKLRKDGNEKEIQNLELEQRIRLLYVEHRQAQEIIDYLTLYVRRIENRGNKKNIL